MTTLAMRIDPTAAFIYVLPWIFVGSGIISVPISTVWRSHLLRFEKWDWNEIAGPLYESILPRGWFVRLDAFARRPDSPARRWSEIEWSIAFILLGAVWILLRN